MVVPLVPAYLSVVWDVKDSAILEGEGDDEVGLEQWYDPVFIFFLVHECEGVMVLHHQDGDALAPDVQHSGVD